MWRVASEAYAYLAGHPFLTDTVLHDRKTDNDRQITTARATESEGYTLGRLSSARRMSHFRAIRRRATTIKLF